VSVAAIDRLIHHAQILSIGGESYRKAQSLAKRTTPPEPSPRRPAKVVVADRTE
jgi:hypothetical protein